MSTMNLVPIWCGETCEGNAGVESRLTSGRRGEDSDPSRGLYIDLT